jgi:hypothetical protein
MTVHMYRIIADKPSSIGEVQANQLVDQWLSTHTPWAADPTSHEIILLDDPLSEADPYFRGDLRFVWDSDMSAIYSQIETDLSGVTSWYQIAYHECTHDEETPQPCSWDEVRENGTIPSDIPTIDVQ